jgi:GT2 family glycosyltransferase
VERKFSVIIPTMFRCLDVTSKLLKNLYEDDSVAEVIIINNSTDTDIPDIPISLKLKIYNQGKNIFVNPAWNLGVSLSTQEYVAILNDDITIPDGIFSQMHYVDFDNIGVVGAYHPLIQEMETPQRFTVKDFQVSPIPIRCWGFGIIMVMAKKNYPEIPDDLLIWAGDDYIFHENRRSGRANGVFIFPIQTKMSTTSNDPIFDKIKNADAVIYDTKYKTD